jgi:hypothetical protein
MNVSHLTARRAHHHRRRQCFLVLAAVILAMPIVLAVDGARAAGPDRLPITVTNDTGRAGPVHLYVLGVDLATGRLGSVDAGGTFRPWSGGTNPPSPAPDVSIDGPADGATTTMAIPRGFSGRVFFSFGEKLHFSLTAEGLVQPAPWASGDANRDILFDWSELTYDDAGLWLNSSGAVVASFDQPSTADVLGCDGALFAPNDQVVGPIARTLCAALNRGTLGSIDIQPGGAAADFYRSSLTNEYARLVHASMADGRAYAFAFDDVQAQESLVHSGDPVSAGIELSSLAPSPARLSEAIAADQLVDVGPERGDPGEQPGRHADLVGTPQLRSRVVGEEHR